MGRGWTAVLNGVVISGGDLPSDGQGWDEVEWDETPWDAAYDAEADVVACLTTPPEGLGVPPLRTEDVTYPQRDGVEMFSDWYEGRIVTLQASIGPSGSCSCGTPRRNALRLSQAWSRHCGDTELVIWPDCDTAWDMSSVPVSGTVQVTNLATSPVPSNTDFVLEGAGYSAAYWPADSTRVFVPEGGDGPDGEAYVRKTITTASTTASRLTWQFTRQGSDSATKTVNAFPVVAGRIYRISFWARYNASIPLAMRLGYRRYAADNSTLSFGTSPDMGMVSGQWARYSAFLTMPAGSTWLAVQQGWVGAGNVVTGDTSDVTRLMITDVTSNYEEDPEYFSGDTEPVLDDATGIWTAYRWAGAENASTSEMFQAQASLDREVTGPFGVKGRPRVCDVRWLPGTRNSVAEATMRFDSTDHRLYILDEDGTPGSGEVCQTVTDTPLKQSVPDVLDGNAFIDQYYSLDSTEFDSNFFSGALVQNACTSAELAQWAGTVPVGGITESVDATTGTIKYEIGGGAGGNTATVTMTDSWTYDSMRPYAVLRYQLYGVVESATLQVSINGGAFANPIGGATIIPSGSGENLIYAAVELSANVTSLAFRFAIDYANAAGPAIIRLADVYSAKSPGHLQRGTPKSYAPQMLPGLSDTSSSASSYVLNTFRKAYTQGIVGWWQQNTGGTDLSYYFRSTGASPFYAFTTDFFGSGPGLVWNDVLQPFNAHVMELLERTDPIMIVITWTATRVRIWSSVDNGGLYPQPHLAQEFVVAGAIPLASQGLPVLNAAGWRVGDMFAGVNDAGYDNAATMETFVDLLTQAGTGEGNATLTLPDIGTECSPLTITFTGGNIPQVVTPDGNYVSVLTNLTGSVAVLDTSTGNLTVNGSIDNTLLDGDPFLTAAPGEILSAYGGGDVTVCFRPAVISA